jgi:hypothetical protein
MLPGSFSDALALSDSACLENAPLPRRLINSLGQDQKLIMERSQAGRAIGASWSLPSG